MSKYTNLRRVFVKVPVQFGKMSKQKRRCLLLGYVGSLIRPPYEMYTYYRIAKGEPSAGRFFVERRYKGDEEGRHKRDGTGVKTWVEMQYIKYADLPDEIKQELG